MTRTSRSKRSPPKSARPRAAKPRAGQWLQQEAKARLSELIRKVHIEGPQHITLHGRGEVVVIAANEFRRLKGSVTGKALIEAMHVSPYREIELDSGVSRRQYGTQVIEELIALAKDMRESQRARRGSRAHR